eukprot:1594203-Rhodomonas_salina.1
MEVASLAPLQSSSVLESWSSRGGSSSDSKSDARTSDRYDGGALIVVIIVLLVVGVAQSAFLVALLAGLVSVGALGRVLRTVEAVLDVAVA